MAATQDGLTFSSPDPDIRDRAVGVILRHIDLAAHLGSGVTIGLIFGQAGREAAERRQRLEHAAACLARCADQAARQGVNLFLEPLNRYESDALNTLADAAAVIRRTGAANVRLLADTFHMNIEEKDPTSALADCRDLLGHIHLADSNREAPGHGHTDFRPILRTLREIGYAGFLSFEVLPRPDGQRALADAVACVTRMLEPPRRRGG
jgi:sugar phosphate isomerase/epimerase